MRMNRVGRIPFLIVLSGALLCSFGVLTRAQEKQDAPADKQQDNGKKKSASTDKKNLRKLEKELATPYKKWLNEEVPYIISDEERSAFLQLATNEEREQFIEAFWQRRDPTPDTVENEFKEEHYRRIAYANERFASGVPGWRTDRGRTYII
jgi:GWxTD domain-containing protein